MPDPFQHNVLIQAALAGIAVKSCVVPATQRVHTGADAPFTGMGASAVRSISLRVQDTAGGRSPGHAGNPGEGVKSRAGNAAALVR